MRDPWSGGVVDIPVAHGVRGHRRGSRCVPHTQPRLLLRLPLSDSSAKHWHAEREPYCDVHAQSLGAPRPPAVSLAAVLSQDASCDVISLTATGLDMPARVAQPRHSAGARAHRPQRPSCGRGTESKAEGLEGVETFEHQPRRASSLSSARAAPVDCPVPLNWQSGVSP